jgi:hypothetical protein
MDITRREEVIRLSGRITSIRENIASLQKDLASAEADLDRHLSLAGMFPQRPIGESPLAIAAGYDDKSLNQQIVELIDSNCQGFDKDLDAEEMLGGLPDGTNLTSVRSALARLADQGKIRRTTRGRYGSIHRKPRYRVRVQTAVVAGPQPRKEVVQLQTHN